MPVTMTIKHVPDRIADRLRRRAEVNRRSLQRELLLILEHAANEGDRVCEPEYPVYHLVGDETGPDPQKRSAARAKSSARAKLSLDALWQRAQRLGAQMPAESAAIVRRDRDARDRR